MWSEGGKERRTPMTLADDRQSAALEQTADVTKTYRIVLLADHGVTTDSPTATLKVISDRPPEFRQVLGLGESLREISANDALRVQLAIEDDFGFSAADIEYRVNDGPIQTQPLPLTGLGSREARGTFVFPLAGKVQVGDQFHCRLRATDNRSIPGIKLGFASCVLSKRRPMVRLANRRASRADPRAGNDCRPRCNRQDDPRPGGPA